MEERATTWGERALTELFGSEVRAAVLSWICAHPDELIVGAKLARELEMSPSAVGKELARLEDLGMLEAAEPIGAAKPYTLNDQFPLLRGLRSICLYATGVVAVLRELFADAEGVEVAAIFGSLARGDDRPDSDVDVMVVGEIWLRSAGKRGTAPGASSTWCITPQRISTDASAKEMRWSGALLMGR